MEFHADLVAVSVTGSDALIHALKKLDFINACLMQSFRDLHEAAEHKLYTQNLFYHQTTAAEHLRRAIKEPDAGKVPPLPADPAMMTQLFNKDEVAESDGMWASHPSHYDREQNAKRHYIRSVEDERSPWLLFTKPEQLRQRMTEKFYRHVLELKSPVFSPAEQVQAFIDNEHGETLQDERYLGVYDGRPLAIPTDLLTGYANDPAVAAMPQAQIVAILNRLYNAEYREWLEAHTKRLEESEMLRGIERSDPKQKKTPFEFRGRKYARADVKSLQELVAKELEADGEWFKTFDREVFQAHLRVAQILQEGGEDLYYRYYFHVNLQDVVRTARQEEIRLMGLFHFASTKENGLTKQEMAQAIGTLKEARHNIYVVYAKTHSITLPALQNLQLGQNLSAFLLPEPLVEPLRDETKIDGTWASKLMNQISQIEERSRRLYFKSMGAILTKQELMVEQYRTRILAASSVPESDSGPRSDEY